MSAKEEAHTKIDWTAPSIHQLWKAGVLDTFIRLGIIRSSVLEWCRIYDTFLEYRYARGYGYSRSIELTAEKLSVTESLVRKAVTEVA